MTDRICGRIKWYNKVKGFGVILGDDNIEYFLHCSNLPAGVQKLSEGTFLQFNSRPRPKNKGGHEAIDVEVLAPKEIRLTPQTSNKSAPTVNHKPPELPQQNKSALTADFWFPRYKTPAYRAPSTEEYRTLEVKVVGVTYEGRQAVVATLSLNEDVLLVREPDNPYDRNAIKVMRGNGQQFGYLSRDLAAQLAEKFDKYGQSVKAIVTALPGGRYTDSSLGVRIRFTVPNIPSDFD